MSVLQVLLTSSSSQKVFNSYSVRIPVVTMILGQIAWVDCFAFLVFLAPQLIIQVGFFQTAFCGIKALPFLCMTRSSRPYALQEANADA